MTNEICPAMKQMKEDELQYKEVKKEVVVALSGDNIDMINAVVAHINTLLACSEAHKSEYRKFLVQLNDRLNKILNEPIDKEFKELEAEVQEALAHKDPFLLEMMEYKVEGFMCKTDKYNKECTKYLEQLGNLYMWGDARGPEYR